MFQVGEMVPTPGGGVGWIEEIRQGEKEAEYRMQFGTRWYGEKALADEKTKVLAKWAQGSPVHQQPRRGRIVNAHRLGRKSQR